MVDLVTPAPETPTPAPVATPEGPGPVRVPEPGWDGPPQSTPADIQRRLHDAVMQGVRAPAETTGTSTSAQRVASPTHPVVDALLQGAQAAGAAIKGAAVQTVTHPLDTARSILGVGVETGKSVARGGVKLAQDVTRTSAETFALTLHALGTLPVGDAVMGQDWMRNYKEMGGARGIGEQAAELFDPVIDSRIIGNRAHSSAQDLIANVSEFIGAFAAGGAGVSAAGAALEGTAVGGAVTSVAARMGMPALLRAAASGAVADAVVNPYQGNLANIIGWDALSVTAQDGPISARIKQMTLGLIPMVGVDLLTWSARGFRAANVLADASAPAAAKAEAKVTANQAADVLEKIQNDTYVPNVPFIVKSLDNGQGFRVTPNLDWVDTGGHPMPETDQWKTILTPEVTGSAPLVDRRAVQGPDMPHPFDRRATTDAAPAPAAPASTVWQEKQTQLEAQLSTAQGDVSTLQANGQPTSAMQGRIREIQDQLTAHQAEKPAVKPAAPAPPAGQTPRAGTDRRVTNTGGAPVPQAVFANREDAEGLASSLNLAHSVRQPIVVDPNLLSDLAQKIRAAQTPEAAQALLESAPRFNMSYMQPPAETKALIEALGEHLGPAFDEAQGRPGISWSQTFERARVASGQVPREQFPALLQTMGDVGKNADVGAAWYDWATKDLADHVRKWSNILDLRPDDPLAAAEHDKALSSFVQTTIDNAGFDSGLGRGLAFLGKPGRSNGLELAFKGEAGAAETVAKSQAADALTRLQQMSPGDRRVFGRLFNLTTNPASLVDVLPKVIKPSLTGIPRVAQGAIEVLMNSILSNVATWKGIFASTGISSVYNDMVRSLAGAVHGDEALMRSGADLIVGRMAYLRQSLSYAAQSLRLGRSIIDPIPVTRAISMAVPAGAGAATKAVGAVVNTAGTVVRSIASHPIAGLDEFWRANGAFAWSWMAGSAEARKLGMQQGLEGPALRNFIRDRAAETVKASIDPSTGKMMLDEARLYGEMPTMSAPLEPGSFGRSIQQLVIDHPVLKPIAPFVRASANIADMAYLRGSPLGALTERYRGIIDRGGPEASVISTHMRLGQDIWSQAGIMAMNGEITGNGPINPAQRALWLEQHRPYTITTDDGEIPYQRFEPFATMLGLTADLAQIKRDHWDNRDATQDVDPAIYGIMAATANAMTNKLYLSAFINFADALGSRDPTSIRRFMQGEAASFIPGALNMVNTDPYIRQVRGMTDAIKNKVPGWSATLPPEYHWNGTPILADPTRAQRSWNLYTTYKPGQGNPISDEMLNLGQGLLPPPTMERYGGFTIDLYDPHDAKKDGTLPYDRWMELLRTGGMQSAIEHVIKDPSFKELGTGNLFGPGERATIIHKLIDKYTYAAREQMLSEYPKLQSRLMAAQYGDRITNKSTAGGNAILQQLRGGQQ